jgi:SAM-dependent methyltransferase
MDAAAGKDRPAMDDHPCTLLTEHTLPLDGIIELMTSRSFEELVSEGADASFSGWDFAWLGGRMIETAPPWDYRAEASKLLFGSRCALDLDTGGGEVLAELAPFAGNVVATEGYEPNVGIAAANLVQFGVPVVAIRSAPDNVDQPPVTEMDADADRSRLPFDDGVFDLVLDRHSSYWSGEIARVLRRGGRFLTQQVGGNVQGRTWAELFGVAPTVPRYDLAFALEQLTAAGLTIRRAIEAQTPTRFLDVGAVVYFLRLAPWTVEGFDVSTNEPELRLIHDLIGSEGALVLGDARFLIEAVSN